MGVRPADDRMYDPMLGEWLVNDQIFEANTQMRPAGGLTLRASPRDTLEYKPIPRERPSGEKPYGLRPREGLVEVPKLKGRPVDGWEYEPFQRERPVGAKACEVMPEERLVDNPTPMCRPVDVQAEEPMSGATPVDDEAYEPMPQNRPIADPRIAIRPVSPITKELTPRDEGCDNQTSMRRPADGEKSIPTTDGRHKAPPPSEVPEWSDGEVMHVIIIDNNSEMPVPKKTDGRVPVDSDNLLPKSLEMDNSGDQGVLSAPMSPNRVRKGHSQDMPAEGSIFDVSPDIPGFHMRPPGAVYSKQILPSPRLRNTSASITRSSEHQLRLLSAKIRREWIPRRGCPFTVYQGTVVLV